MTVTVLWYIISIEFASCIYISHDHSGRGRDLQILI